MTTISTPTAITTLLAAQRAFFATGATHPLAFRLEQLQRLKAAISARQSEIVQAVKSDLGRPDYEGYFEVGVLTELAYILKHLKSWVKPRKVGLPLAYMPGSAGVQPDPLGVVLIIGPWNYPFQLAIIPLANAIAAGNRVMIKPSEFTPRTSALLG